ncbi:MAG: hypothetical protein M1823_006153 [Watsoniomyces obsoletus]|nr:MAG: hypothetical protein M1823_006153 [Watsoniomyces obsoletus]
MSAPSSSVPPGPPVPSAEDLFRVGESLFVMETLVVPGWALWPWCVAPSVRTVAQQHLPSPAKPIELNERSPARAHQIESGRPSYLLAVIIQVSQDLAGTNRPVRASTVAINGPDRLWAAASCRVCKVARAAIACGPVTRPGAIITNYNRAAGAPFPDTPSRSATPGPESINSWQSLPEGGNQPAYSPWPSPSSAVGAAPPRGGETAEDAAAKQREVVRSLWS